MKNIVVECQKMCYDVKRVIALQGGEPPKFEKEGRWCRDGYIPDYKLIIFRR